MIPEERALWFVGARGWLELWLENTTSCEDEEHAQVFSRSRFLPFDSSSLFIRGECDPRKLADLRHRTLSAMILDLNEEFIPMVLFALVFGAETHSTDTRRQPHTIPGFVAQAGRLPTAEDRVKIHVSHRDDRADEMDDGISLGHHWRIVRLQILTPTPKTE